MSDFEEDPEPTIDSNPNLMKPVDVVSTGPLSSLSEEQRTRVGALNMAKPLLVDQGVLGGSKAPDIGDLIRLATWILDGNEEPLYPFVSGDTVILGPEVFVSTLGDVINWRGTNFYVREEMPDA